MIQEADNTVPVERAEAFTKYGFQKSDRLLVGILNHNAYNGYWTISNYN